MIHVSFLLATGLGLLQDKAALPADADLKKAEGSIKATFVTEFAAKDRASRRIAGRKFLSQASGAKDPAERYVLLRSAVEWASTSLDISTALRACEEIAARYDVAPLTSHTTSIALIKKVVAVPEDVALAADMCLAVWERAVSFGDLDFATKLASDALDLAKKSGDTNLKSACDDFVRDTAEAKRLQERATKGGEACADTGLYLVAVKGEISKGIALLAAAAEDPIGSVAKKDAANPQDPETRFEIGEAWGTIAIKEKNSLLRRAWELRSRVLQEEAFRSSTGLVRTRLTKKLMKGLSIIKAMFGKTDVTTLIVEAIERDPWTPLRADIYLASGNGSLTIDYLWQGKRLFVSAKDMEVIVLPEVPEKGAWYPFASRSFRVIATHHGIATTFFDCTDRVQKAMLDPFQAFGGGMSGTDPFPGRPKTAVIQYEWHGRRFVRSVRDGEAVVPATSEKSRP